MTYKRLKGSQNLRLRLLLATLSATPVLIEDIRADETIPGLRPHEISFLRLLERISDDCLIEINETGKFSIIHIYFISVYQYVSSGKGGCVWLGRGYVHLNQHRIGVMIRGVKSSNFWFFNFFFLLELLEFLFSNSGRMLINRVSFYGV